MAISGTVVSTVVWFSPDIFNCFLEVQFNPRIGFNLGCGRESIIVVERGPGCVRSELSLYLCTDSWFLLEFLCQ